MKKFGLIGAAGYIAKRHVEAIKTNNCNLLMMCDPNDNVGFIDQYFPDALYFNEIERFDRQLNRFEFENNKIDYVTICTPNYLHDSHIRLSLRNNCNVICEKPLVIKKEHVSMLQEIEIKAGKKVFSILQLRLHPVIKEMKKSLNLTKKRHFVELNYITPRGKWYDYSWKGNFDKSGGVLFNIGIHFFDMLIWIFGRPISHDVDLGAKSAEGILKLEKADVKFKLSIDHNDLPYNDWLPKRSLTSDKKEFNFSEGFTDLHNESYRQIINGNGFNLEETLPAIDLVEQIINK